MRRAPVVWLGLGALVVLAVAGVVILGSGHAPTTSVADTAVVRRGTVTAVVSASGTVQAASERGLSFSVTGTVTELHVSAGDPVRPGQVLARIDATDTQSSLAAAQARVQDAVDAVTRAELAASTPACPSTTTPAEPPTGAPTGAPSGPPASAGASAGPRASATCTPAGRAGDSLLSAQQQLNNANLAVTGWQQKLAGTVITAPTAGRVLFVGGRVGTVVSPGGTGFIVLGDVSTAVVKAEFAEADVVRLAVGQPASVTLPNGREPIPGQVSQVDPAGTATNRLVRYGVLVALATPAADLLLGQSATVSVTTAVATGVLYVSSAAITSVDADQATVLVRLRGHDENRAVRLGVRGDQYTEVTQGLAEGERVVLP